MKIGTLDISKLSVGNREVIKINYGTVTIYEAGSSSYSYEQSGSELTITNAPYTQNGSELTIGG